MKAACKHRKAVTHVPFRQPSRQADPAHLRAGKALPIYPERGRRGSSDSTFSSANLDLPRLLVYGWAGVGKAANPHPLPWALTTWDPEVSGKFSIRRLLGFFPAAGYTFQQPPL